MVIVNVFDVYQFIRLLVVIILRNVFGIRFMVEFLIDREFIVLNMKVLICRILYNIVLKKNVMILEKYIYGI